MTTLLDHAFMAGMACLDARSTLLDDINVYPVADGDTGVNLRISLGPLRSCVGQRAALAESLLQSATGNSGNIAVAFFREFIQADSSAELAACADIGRRKAWLAVADPQHGTILDVFDRLALVLDAVPIDRQHCGAILDALQEEVRTTAEILPHHREAGVVDAGALGMYLFFDGFFRSLTLLQSEQRSLFAIFDGLLKRNENSRQEAASSVGYCVEALLKTTAGTVVDQRMSVGFGDSVVAQAGEGQLKLHVHTSDPVALREKMSGMGEILFWSHESLASRPPVAKSMVGDPCIHIMTDAAGSLTRTLASAHQISLLDSYVVIDGRSWPETLCDPDDIYLKMRRGTRVTTAQASNFARQQLYQGVCEQYGDTLYLVVGSSFTGNYGVASAWMTTAAGGSRLHLVDTGAASGRLAVIALQVARYAGRTSDREEVIAYAEKMAESCREYVFIDTLQYLVNGGRVSRASGFFGELLHLKPVISPTREGVKKVGMVRNQKAQLEFLKAKLAEETTAPAGSMLLLQYSDNRQWVSNELHAMVHEWLPDVEILVQPLSLTSGVHMGPGTWAVAFG
jgi:DegV family protein with EDD domain